MEGLRFVRGGCCLLSARRDHILRGRVAHAKCFYSNCFYDSKTSHTWWSVGNFSVKVTCLCFTYAEREREREREQEL